MTDIIIDDDYVLQMANYMGIQGARLEMLLNNYLSLLQEAIVDGIKNGQTQSTLQQYLTMVQEIQGSIQEISIQGRNTTIRYLQEIDTADEYLY